jgi:hypothetical protein
MHARRRKSNSFLISILVIAAAFTTSCASHLDKGWKLFEKGQYLPAQGEWAQEKKPVLTELVEKAGSAVAMEKYHQKIKQAESAGENREMLKSSLLLLAEDKWPDNRDWLKRSPPLQTYIDDAHKSVEAAVTQILTESQQQKNWDQLITDFKQYTDYCLKYGKQPTASLVALSQEAEAGKKEMERQRQLKLARERERRNRIALFNKNLKCGKTQFLNEDYDAAMTCLNSAAALAQKYPGVDFERDDLKYVTESTQQAIEIQKAMELERQRVAEAKRKKIEQELRLEAERQRKIEEERRKVEEERIRQAKAAERKRLQEIERKRQIEAEKQRKIDEKNRRWRAFLKKGAPLTPLVTTVMKPSRASGTLKKKKKQKWQGGSQLPKPKDKSIASEDVYALGVEVPRKYSLTYLRNYFHRKKNAPDRLKAPITQKGKRSYYTEDFKGGRYYLEIKNDRAGSKEKYHIRTHIYKIPVTN